MITAHDFKVGDLVQPKNTSVDFAGRKGVIRAVGPSGGWGDPDLTIITVFWIVARAPRGIGEHHVDARFIVPLAA